MFNYLEKNYDSPAELIGEVDAMLDTLHKLRGIQDELIKGYAVGLPENEIQNLKIELNNLNRKLYNLLFDMKNKLKNKKVYRVCVHHISSVLVDVKAENEEEAQDAAVTYVADNFVGSMGSYDCEDIEDWDTTVCWSDVNEDDNYTIEA